MQNLLLSQAPCNSRLCIYLADKERGSTIIKRDSADQIVLLSRPICRDAGGTPYQRRSWGTSGGTLIWGGSYLRINMYKETITKLATETSLPIRIQMMRRTYILYSSSFFRMAVARAALALTNNMSTVNLAKSHIGESCEFECEVGEGNENISSYIPRFEIWNLKFRLWISTAYLPIAML